MHSHASGAGYSFKAWVPGSNPAALTIKLFCSNSLGRVQSASLSCFSERPIGLANVSDSPQGLLVKGELVVEVPEPKSAYALLRRGVIRGLSIGYDTVKSVMDGGVRKLTELKLWEISVVTFPMNPEAMVTSVKSEADQIAAFRRVLAECRKGF